MRLRLVASAIVAVFLLAIGFSGSARAQEGDKAKSPQASDGNGWSGFNKIAYARIKVILIASAEKMPEENYNFKPTDAVRSYGQIIGHLADAQYNFCSMARGEKNPGLKIE